MFEMRSRHPAARIPILALCLLLLLPMLVLPARAQEAAVPAVSAKSAVLMEAESGEVVFSHAADTRLPMASTTKIATALTALSLADPEDIITVDAAAVGTEGSSVYLIAGEELTLEQLLYALLLESANDAAVAIAIGVSGSVAAFADEMNALAASLGLENTHFTNPHGLDDENHYTTASELAELTRHALQNELFATIVSTRKTTIPHPADDGVRALVNHNKLLRMYEGCIGVKTGYTKRSGRCLVSAAEREGVRLIAVTLHAPDDWNDHGTMLDYGFTRYRSVLLCNPEDCSFSLPVTGGTTESLLISNTDLVRVTLPVGYGPIRVTVEAPHFLYAPVAAGEPIGMAVFRCDTDGDGSEELLAEVPLYACEAAERFTPKKNFWLWLKSLFCR